MTRMTAWMARMSPAHVVSYTQLLADAHLGGEPQSCPASCHPLLHPHRSELLCTQRGLCRDVY